MVQIKMMILKTITLPAVPLVDIPRDVIKYHVTSSLEVPPLLAVDSPLVSVPVVAGAKVPATNGTGEGFDLVVDQFLVAPDI